MGKEVDKSAISDSHLDQIRKMAETMRYGSINLIFQDGKLVQIDRSEKIRITDQKN